MMPADTAPGVPIAVVIGEPDGWPATVLERALSDDRFSTGRCAGTAAELLAAADHAAVLIIGPSIARTGLAALTPRLISRGARLLVVSGVTFDEDASMLLLAGATGFLSMTDAGADDVAAAVLSIAEGSTSLNADVVHEVLTLWRRQRAAPPGDAAAAAPAQPPGALTVREADVLHALRDGLTNRLIAKRLGVAEKTIEAHKSKLFAKLGARNQAQAVQLAADRGLL